MSATLLAELLDATPLPPETEDVDELLAAFELMYATRQPLLAAAKATELRPSPQTRTLLHELVAREAAWQRALETARDAVGAVRWNAHRLRGYAR